MNVNELMNKLQNTLKKLIDENDLSVKTTELSNELLETIKILENCTSCKYKDKKIDGNDLDKIENCLAKLEQRKKEKFTISRLNNKLDKIDFELNKKVSCEGCKEKKIEKLIDKYGNEEIARLLYYQCKLKAYGYDSYYIRWIPFNEFKNIEYLAKGDFAEVHKAIWFNGYYKYYKDIDVVLKKIYNHSSDDKIVDILREVK